MIPTPIREFYDGLRKHFKITSHTERAKLLDQVYVQLRKEVKIDIILFDDWLHEKYPNYEEELGLSMGELLDQKYGVEASRFVRKFL